MPMRGLADKPAFRLWELLELARKLVLTGVILLIPWRQTLTRLVAAILVSLGHLVLLAIAAPHVQRSTYMMAVAVSMTLLCALLLSFLLRTAHEFHFLTGAVKSLATVCQARDATSTLDDDDGNQCPALASVLAPTNAIFDRLFDESSAGVLTAIMLSFNIGVLAICAAFVGLESQQINTLRVQASGRPPKLTLSPTKRWHLFCSHNWQNQDATATIKRQLQLLVPGIRVFLE